MACPSITKLSSLLFKSIQFKFQDLLLVRQKQANSRIYFSGYVLQYYHQVTPWFISWLRKQFEFFQFLLKTSAAFLALHYHIWLPKQRLFLHCRHFSWKFSTWLYLLSLPWHVDVQVVLQWLSDTRRVWKLQVWNVFCVKWLGYRTSITNNWAHLCLFSSGLKETLRSG